MGNEIFAGRGEKQASAVNLCDPAIHHRRRREASLWSCCGGRQTQDADDDDDEYDDDNDDDSDMEVGETGGRDGSAPLVLSSIAPPPGRPASVPQELRVVLEFARGVTTDGGDGEAADSEERSEVRFCWVDRDGALHHHRVINKSLTEHTRTHDAFVLYRQKAKGGKDANDPESLPENAEALAADAAREILCSYRLSKALYERKSVHELRLAFDAGGSFVAANARAAPKPDGEYRVVARLPEGCGDHRLPRADLRWTIRYRFVCPPLPDSGTFDPRSHTFYVWGDVDFDDYGAGRGVGARRAVHPCIMNQIVPQVMIGNCLASNDKEFRPSWKVFSRWVIQAQYYWQDAKGEGDGCHAHCGKIVEVNPGDALCTRISYDPRTGALDVSIGVESDDGPDAEKTSALTVPRPFMHDPTLFADWLDFFRKCQDVDENFEDGAKNAAPFRKVESPEKLERSSRGPLGRPALNVEYKGSVDAKTLASVCPLDVREAYFPVCAPRPRSETSLWQTELFCPRLGHVASIGGLNLEDSITLGGKKGGTPMRRIAKSLRR